MQGRRRSDFVREGSRQRGLQSGGHERVTGRRQTERCTVDLVLQRLREGCFGEEGLGIRALHSWKVTRCSRSGDFNRWTREVIDELLSSGRVNAPGADRKDLYSEGQPGRSSRNRGEGDEARSARRGGTSGCGGIQI